MAYNILGLSLIARNRISEGLSCLLRSLSIWEREYSPDHPILARVLTNIGAAYARLGLHAEADSAFRRALEIAESKLGPEHTVVADALAGYAEALRKSKRKTEAKELDRRAAAIYNGSEMGLLARHTVHLSDLRPASTRPQGYSRRPVDTFHAAPPAAWNIFLEQPGASAAPQYCGSPHR
jgi:tetratricopeptide (TPR) repeat protein